MPLCEALARPAGVEGHITCTRIASETGISRVWPPLSSGVCRVRRSASERRGAVADDARAREVGLRHSSCGAGGAKDGDQGKCGPAKHVPGAEPDKRVTSAGAHTESRKGKEEEAHRALPPHQHR